MSHSILKPIHGVQWDHWTAPWNKDMKDHCIRRYCSALKKAMGKTVQAEVELAKVNPACSNECKLQTGPPPPESPSRSSSVTAKYAAPALSQARAASEEQSAQLLQQASGLAPEAAAESTPEPTPESKQQQPGQHDHLFRPPGAAAAGGASDGSQPPPAPAAAKENGDAQLPGLDDACTRCNELGVCTAADKKEDETEEERRERLESTAAGVFRSVVQEATGGAVGTPV